MEPSRGSLPPGVSARFWSLVTAERLAGATVLDVGTGAGRVALALAPLCGRVVGIDSDAAALEQARRRAAAAALTNAEFRDADADRVEYVDVHPDLVTAHLFMSDALVARAARALRPGGALVIVAFHVDQWRETGRPSRFAYDEERMRNVLESAGFAVEHLEVERDVRTFPSLEAALAHVIALEERWKSDGRWVRYIKFLEQGGRTLTRSHLVVKARRR
jgi:ubiquinone/menaquinone biosynthesis C-methylase UbiE